MDADRRAAIIRLLEHRHDHLPEPRRRDERRAGFVHDTLAPQVCPTCDGVDDRCADCHGRGWVEVRRHRDPYEQPGRGGRDHDRGYALDRAIAAADRELRRFPGFRPLSEADVLAEAGERDYGWLEARRRWHLAELERALDRIRLADELVWRATRGLWHGSPLLELGLRALDRLLPDPLRAPAAAGGRQVGETRDQRIARLVLEEGVVAAQVAAVEGLSVSQVNRIVRRATVERGEAA